MTVTPFEASSEWVPSVRLSTNAFVAAYVAVPGIGWKAAVEATLMIAPRPRSAIAGE